MRVAFQMPALYKYTIYTFVKMQVSQIHFRQRLFAFVVLDYLQDMMHR